MERDPQQGRRGDDGLPSLYELLMGPIDALRNEMAGVRQEVRHALQTLPANFVSRDVYESEKRAALDRERAADARIARLEKTILSVIAVVMLAVISGILATVVTPAEVKR